MSVSLRGHTYTNGTWYKNVNEQDLCNLVDNGWNISYQQVDATEEKVEPENMRKILILDHPEGTCWKVFRLGVILPVILLGSPAILGGSLIAVSVTRFCAEKDREDSNQEKLPACDIAIGVLKYFVEGAFSSSDSQKKVMLIKTPSTESQPLIS
jgi:hypothetical protein